jgi:hypothetical protein
MICHRRAGKTVASLMDLLDAACKKPNGRYCYIAPLRAASGPGRFFLAFGLYC